MMIIKQENLLYSKWQIKMPTWSTVLRSILRSRVDPWGSVYKEELSELL